MKTNKILFLVATIIMAFGMTACQISKEEQRALEEQSPLAKAYYEEKYDTDIEIEDAFYNYYISDDFFRHYITSEMIFVTNEDTFITYSIYEKVFKDNRQQTQIVQALEDALLPGLADFIKNPFYWEIDSESFTCNLESIGGNFDYHFYHNYFDKNNWLEFFEEEKPSVNFDSTLYIISNENTKFDEITEYISALFSQYMRVSNLKIVFLSEDLYQTQNLYDFEGEDGFYGTYRINGNYRHVVKQNYVKVTDGVYITSLDSDFSFEESDFEVFNQMDFSDAISIYNNAYSGKVAKIDPYSFQPSVGYAFQVGLTDSYKSRTDYNYDYGAYHDLCIKIVPEELDGDLNKFILFITYEDYQPDCYEISLESEPTTFYKFLHYNDTTNFYFCFGEELPTSLSPYDN